MKILIDFHHQSLFHSLVMLFEDRLGWEVYRPIGTDWYTEGFWMVYDHPATAAQYLGLHQGSQDFPTGITEFKNSEYSVVNDVYFVEDGSYNRVHRAVTLQAFKDMDFDVVLSSIPAHIPRFSKLIKEHQPKAKHVFQIGNAWGRQGGVSNILASTSETSRLPRIPAP